MEIEHFYRVIISERAEQNLDEIVDYLIIHWNEKVKINFIEEFKKIVDCLKITPYIFPVFSEKKGIRKCLITKHNALYYCIENFTVKIITIHNTYRNPKKLVV